MVGTNAREISDDPKHAAPPPPVSINASLAPGVQATYDEVTHGNLPLAARVPQEMKHLAPEESSKRRKGMWVVVGCVCLVAVIYFSLS